MRTMFNINDNKRYTMFFAPFSQDNFRIGGSWELVNDSMNFSLLIDNSKSSWVNLLLTVRESNAFCSNFNLHVATYAQPYGMTNTPPKKIGEQFNINYVASNSILDTQDYEISLEIPPGSFVAGAYFLYPIIHAEYEGEDLGVVCKGKKVAVQVLDLTY